MIGLEGSGFTICLGVILLLTGIVMYYCKSKISACENKMNTMLTLISELHTEVNSLKQNNYQGALSSQVTPDTAIDENINDLPSDDDEESDSESDENEQITRKEIVNPFETHPYKELIPTNTNLGGEIINESSESEDDTDEENEKKEVKVVDLLPIEELSVHDLEEDSDNEDLQETSEEEVTIDYGKMQVTALKKLAAERQLAPNVHKLRKGELVTLLQSQ